MKILHTADWHIGKIVNEFSMIEDQEYILNQLIEKIKELQVDALIMAGDLYDRSIPPKEAVNLVNQTFTRIIKEVGIPILVIAGNHDSNERLEFAADLLGESNLYIEGTVKKEVRKVTIDGVNFYLLPFGDHVQIRKILKCPEISNIEEATKKQVEQIKENLNPNEVNIMIAHGYVINQTAETLEDSDSERPLSIGTVEYIDASVFEIFDYVALGHLHKAQKVKGEKVRYSGSPLKYSKSEVKHHKQCLLIEIEKDFLTVEPIELTPKREMRTLKGSFEELMKGQSKDYLFFELDNSKYIADAMNQLRRRYPFAMGLEYVNMQTVAKKSNLSRKKVQKQSVTELFDEFYTHYKNESLDEDGKEAILDIYNTVEKKRG